MDSRAPSMLKATLIGGVVFGVLGGIPLVSCLCCALMVGAGFLAAFLYSKECANAGVEFKGGNGALVGLVAALFYALANAVVGALVKMMMPATDPDQVVEMMEQFGAPPEAIDMALKFVEGSSGLIGVLIGFFVTLLIAAIFSTIGGVIGGAVFKVEPPPAPPTVQTPPPGEMPTE